MMGWCVLVCLFVCLFVCLCVFLLASSWPVKNARRQQTLKAPVPVLQLEELDAAIASNAGIIC